jgi:nucleoside-diphosphate-sugar epimerase
MLNDLNVGLLGSNGFVGQSINRKFYDIKKYNRQNMHNLLNEDLDLLIVAAVSAEKWRANSNPSADRENIENLISFLEKIKINKFLLISTIDVFGPNIDFDEDTEMLEGISTAYGHNRSFLEQRLIQISEETKILRLPGLFGPGLKKNLLFDLLNGNKINVASLKDCYQYLYAPRIGEIIVEMLATDSNVFHASTEPIKVVDILRVASTCIGTTFEDLEINDKNSIIRYNMRTKYRKSGYLFDSIEVLNEIEEWFRIEKT